MKSLIIFIPINIKDQLPGLLLGKYREHKVIHSALYIFGYEVSQNFLKKSANTYSVVGSYSTRYGQFQINDTLKRSPVWISVTCNNKEIFLNCCKIHTRDLDLKDCLVVIYDACSLIKSELLFVTQKKKINGVNHFKKLVHELQTQTNQEASLTFQLFLSIINIIGIAFSILNYILMKSSYITKYSAFALYLKNYCHTVLWMKNECKEHKYISLKTGNYLAAILTDMLLGILLFYFVTIWKKADHSFDSLSSCTEDVISSISQLVNWLMGSPAGLKLNQPLSSLFGSIVLYYLEIWWSFLNLVRPVLEICFQIFMKMGFLGMTFQLAVCADIFSIISFHVYCIYVYAARLYEIQAKGLYSLCRLFLGRKRNPEPGKVDSYPYSTEELLIGTISFAVLLFLLPTTLVYYVVFTGMRLGVKIISGILTRTIYFMKTLPVYVTFLWLFFPTYIATTVKVTPPNRVLTLDHGYLLAHAVSSSWIETVKHSIPDVISPPVPVNLGETMWNIIVGKIL